MASENIHKKPNAITVIIIEDEESIAAGCKETLLLLDKELQIISDIMIFHNDASFLTYNASSSEPKVFIVDLILHESIEIGEGMGTKVMNTLVSKGQNRIYVRSGNLGSRAFMDMFENHQNIVKIEKTSSRKRDLTPVYEGIKEYHDELNATYNIYVERCLDDGGTDILEVDKEDSAASIFYKYHYSVTTGVPCLSPNVL
jgi:hypothetical protein